MSPHQCDVESKVDVRTTNARVPLNVGHPELSRQIGHRHTLEIIPNSGAIRYSQLSHALFNTVHTRIGIINDCGLNYSGWNDLKMSM